MHGNLRHQRSSRSVIPNPECFRGEGPHNRRLTLKGAYLSARMLARSSLALGMTAKIRQLFASSLLKVTKWQSEVPDLLRAFELLPRHFYLPSELSRGFGNVRTLVRFRKEKQKAIVG